MTKPVIFNDLVGLELPGEWEDRSIYTFVAPEQTSVASGLPTMAKTQGFRPNVVITREPKGKTQRIDAYAKEQLAISQKQLPQMKVLEDKEHQISDQAAVTRVFTFVAPPQNIMVQQLQTFVLSGDYIYTFTFSSLPDGFANQRKAFDQILGSVRFK